MTPDNSKSIITVSENGTISFESPRYTSVSSSGCIRVLEGYSLSVTTLIISKDETPDWSQNTNVRRL
jgi:hypothetical protein